MLKINARRKLIETLGEERKKGRKKKERKEKENANDSDTGGNIVQPTFPKNKKGNQKTLNAEHSEKEHVL